MEQNFVLFLKAARTDKIQFGRRGKHAAFEVLEEFLILFSFVDLGYELCGWEAKNDYFCHACYGLLSDLFLFLLSMLVVVRVNRNTKTDDLFC